MEFPLLIVVFVIYLSAVASAMHEPRIREGSIQKFYYFIMPSVGRQRSYRFEKRVISIILFERTVFD